MINGNATPLQAVNNYMDQVQLYNATQTKTETFTVAQEFTTLTAVETGSANAFRFGLRYAPLGGSNITVTLDPGGTPKSYLEITKTCQAADNRTFNVPANLPYGQAGIKLIDFIKGIQRKFNLVIYPDKDNFNNMIVETFNDWYNKGTVLNLNQYVDLNHGMEVIPANSLAVNKLGFGDKLDSDYISSQFRSRNGREYGKQTYVDTVNDFSSGEYNVTSTFASSPILHITNTGLSGSAGVAALKVDVQETYQGSQRIICSFNGDDTFVTRYRLTATLKDSGGTTLTSNPYGDFVIPMRFDRSGSPCSSAGTFTDYILIPFGATSGYIDYLDGEWEVCFGCELLNITPNCVDINNASIPPNTTLSLYFGSDYPQC